MVSFSNAVKNFYVKTFRFKGRASRAEFWWVELYYVLAILLFVCIDVCVSVLSGQQTYIFPLLATIFILINAIPKLSLTVRRIHDLGFSAWFLLIILFFGLLLGIIPYIGGLIRSIILIIIFAMPGNKYANGYEDDSYAKNQKTIETESVEL